MSVKIKLGGKHGPGKYAIISEEDFERVSARTWTLHIDAKSPNLQYAHTADGKGGRIYLHRFILGDKEGHYVDHINQDTLDNRRENLRHLTPVTSLLNRRLKRMKGFTKYGNKWTAQTRVNGKLKYLGMFNTPEEAHAAYLLAVEENERIKKYTLEQLTT